MAEKPPKTACALVHKDKADRRLGQGICPSRLRTRLGPFQFRCRLVTHGAGERMASAPRHDSIGENHPHGSR